METSNLEPPDGIGGHDAKLKICVGSTSPL
jgi:hypothetical protein